MRSIARVLHRSVSTLSDEIARNSANGVYDPEKAHAKARVRRQNAKYQAMKIVGNRALQHHIETLLFDDQSPRAIAGRLKKEHKKDASRRVSKESIYRYVGSVYGRLVEAYRKKKKNGNAKKRSQSKGSLSDRVFIDKRPDSINRRRRLGNAEADFIVSGKGGKGILLVVVDRKSRAAFLELILKVTIANVHRAFQCIKKRFSEMRTLTLDNDILFQRHKELEQLLGLKIYFCNPYHSWENGTVENVNKYIRREIPKGSDLSHYTKQFIRNLEAKLNRRILEVLRFSTPEEVLERLRKQKMRLSAEKKRSGGCSD